MQADMFPETMSRPEDDRDSRYTPEELVRLLHAEHRFTVDAASAPEAPSSTVIGRFWTQRENGLLQPWRGERVWCNPPWSDIEPWVAKAWEEMRMGCELVVMLLPAWTDRGWWHRHVEPFRERGPRYYLGQRRGVCMRTRFLRRMPFGHPGNPHAVGVEDPHFWCVLVVWEVDTG